jgi:uncharacterized protein YlxW (UPF0749 family)
MPLVGLKEAARITGKNQSTIHRAMKSGRLTFTISDVGERMIDTAELDRVFQVRPNNEHARNDAMSLQNHVEKLAQLRAQLEAERAKSAVAQERLGEKDAVIADLREDRDRWRMQAEKLLLTDQRERMIIASPPVPAAASAPAPVKRRWWQLGGRG